MNKDLDKFTTDAELDIFKEDKEAITKVFKTLALIGAVFKSLFEALVQIVWGLASVMFLSVLLVYLHINNMLDEVNIDVLQQFHTIFDFIIQYWGILFMLLTIFYCYVNIKEVNRPKFKELEE